MAAYHVDPDDGDDGDDGSESTPWATIEHAISSSGVADTSVENTIWLKPAIYKEAISPSWTAPTARQMIKCDSRHQKDWATPPDLGLTVAVWTNFLTDFQSSPDSSACLTTSSGMSNCTLKDVFFVAGGTNGCFYNTTSAVSVALTFEDCIFYYIDGSNGLGIRLYTEPGTPADLTIRRCIFDGGSNNIWLLMKGLPSADQDENILIESCLFLDSNDANIEMQANSTDSFEPGGVTIVGCYFRSTYTEYAVSITGSQMFGTYPCTIKQNLIMSGRGNGLDADDTGQVVSDENYINCPAGTAFNNVTPGASDVTDEATLFAYGRGMQGLFTPLRISDHVGSMSSTLLTALDFNGVPRPGGGFVTATPGALEPLPNLSQETSTVPPGESDAIKMVGPNTFERAVAVDAEATTLSVEARFDATYTGTKPSIELRDCEELGVSEDSDIVTASANTWDTLSVTFTPSKAGQVTIRYVSEDTNGSGAALFGKITVS